MAGGRLKSHNDTPGVSHIMQPVLSIRGLSKSYKGGLQALKTVDLDQRRVRDRDADDRRDHGRRV